MNHSYLDNEQSQQRDAGVMKRVRNVGVGRVVLCLGAELTVPGRRRAPVARRRRPTVVAADRLADRRPIPRRRRCGRVEGRSVELRMLKKMENVLDVVAFVAVQPPRLQFFDVVEQRRQLHLAMVQFLCMTQTFVRSLL